MRDAGQLGLWEAAFCVGCLLAGAGALAGSRWLASAGSALVIGCALVCARIVAREERLMRVPTSGCAGIGHRGERHTVAAQVTAREAGTP